MAKVNQPQRGEAELAPAGLGIAEIVDLPFNAEVHGQTRWRASP